MNREQGTGSREQAAASSSDFELTLRLLARLSAPEGLEERVEASLRAAPRATTSPARILRWPVALENSWVRAAAAAAILAVMLGGGWGVYSLVQPVRPLQPARAVAAPPHLATPGGGFSNAGAMRTPHTLNGPVVAPQSKPEAKPAAHSSGKALHRAQPTAASEDGPAAIPGRYDK
jgi:hypothetical protein